MKQLYKLKSTALFIMILSFLSYSTFSQENADKSKKSASKYKKYSEIVTDSTVTKKGVFTTHQVNGELYYEISPSQLGKEFLWVTQYEKTQTSYGYGGTEVIRRVVRWERFEDQILLRNVEYDLRADEGTPEKKAVEGSSVEAIIKAFKIVSFAPDKTPVIQVTELFTGDTYEFSPKQNLDAQGIDKSRTFITSVKCFEKNIETRVLSTFTLKPPTPAREGNRRPVQEHSDPSLGTVTVELHHSMIALPETLMKPRLFDKRVGFFAGSFENYSNNIHQVEEVRYIRRWRLEKKNPEEEVSEPVKPIVYYISKEIPAQWHKYIKEGVEMWQPVFEKAGFKNAIIAKEAPTPEEDPNYDPEDVRYSAIRWLPSTIANAYGPHVQDPRSGEILEADIRVFHNVLSLIRDWYFVQASPSDKRAQQIPMPDEVIGEGLRYVIAHEVGHTLGLRHNFKSTSYYKVENYRSKEFTNKYGLEASIMDYGRFNYIAQPGDSARTIPIIGPYDYFAIEWGYKEFKENKTPQEDVPFLNKLADKQLTDPMLRFGGGRENGDIGQGDPHARSEDLGDDPIKATTYGLKNIEYITNYLVKATGEQEKDYTMLEHMYDAALDQMYREVSNVAAMVGGIEIDNLVFGQSADVFKPTTAAEQKAAVAYILKNGFKTQPFLLNKDIITRIGMNGITKNISERQKQLLTIMINEKTISRMLDVEASGYSNYTVTELFRDLKNGIFEELKTDPVKVDIFRRNLQRAFVEQLISNISTETAAKSDLQAVARGTLINIKRDLDTQIAKYVIGIEHYHFVDLSNMIKVALENK